MMLPLSRLEASDVCVSIIITNYNYSKYVAESIGSALNQTYSKKEVIVIDDGSTDDSVDIISRYPVRLFVQGNLGLSASRNRGAKIARGDYLVFLDADDIIEPTYVEECLDALLKQSSVVAYVYTQMQLFGETDSIFYSKPFDAVELLRNGNFINSSCLIRKASLLECGGFSLDWNHPLEDYLFYVKLLSFGHHGYLLEKPLLKYRKHGKSMNPSTSLERNELAWCIRLKYFSLSLKHLSMLAQIELLLRKLGIGFLVLFLRKLIFKA